MNTQMQKGMKLSARTLGRYGAVGCHVMMLCFAAMLANAAPKKVLFYGLTHEPSGVRATLVNNNPAEFYPIGQGSEVWTPGDPVAAKDWNKKTTADFQAFDAIVIGDLRIP